MHSVMKQCEAFAGHLLSRHVTTRCEASACRTSNVPSSMAVCRIKPPEFLFHDC